MKATEFLLTSDRHFHGDVVVDRGWTPSRDEDGHLSIVKPDGTTVRPIRVCSGILMVPPFSVVHIGYGFREWGEREITAAWGALRGKQAEIKR